MAQYARDPVLACRFMCGNAHHQAFCSATDNVLNFFWLLVRFAFPHRDIVQPSGSASMRFGSKIGSVDAVFPRAQTTLRFAPAPSMLLLQEHSARAAAAGTADGGMAACIWHE